MTSNYAADMGQASGGMITMATKSGTKDYHLSAWEYIRNYPLMKEAAQFFLDYLVPDGKGHLVTEPSISPENTYRMPSGEKASLTVGPTMDTEILYALFGRVIEASETLGIDADFRAKIAAARDKLLPLFASASLARLWSGLKTTRKPNPAIAICRSCSPSSRATRSRARRLPNWPKRPAPPSNGV